VPFFQEHTAAASDLVQGLSMEIRVSVKLRQCEGHLRTSTSTDGVSVLTARTDSPDDARLMLTLRG
uniref:Uncharacterized protein n=1 Tax=Acanthochromis polyacanthus TaxID=80966 RepID=A0A3Q1FDD2_9TELE